MSGREKEDTPVYKERKRSGLQEAGARSAPRRRRCPGLSSPAPRSLRPRPQPLAMASVPLEAARRRAGEPCTSLAPSSASLVVLNRD